MTGHAARRHVVQVVRSDGFAGVERYVLDVTGELIGRGWRVTVVGGDPARMQPGLPAAARFVPAATVVDVARTLWMLGRCDVVHAHMTAAELPAVLLRHRSRALVVVTRHFAAHRGSNVAGRVAGRIIARGVDVQLAISEYVAHAIEGASVVVPNGVSLAAEAQPARSRTVVVVQRLDEEKDTDTAVRAWATSGLHAQGWRLEIYGRGVRRAALERLVLELGVAHSVTFGGFVDNPRVHLAAASMMLATAPAEPFGLAVVEAMAEGTPVVAADGGAHRETLGADGAFFPPGDAQAAAAQLVRLAGSEADRLAVGERLRTRHRALFSVVAHVDGLERVYST